MHKIPDVWKKLGGFIHQDYILDYPDFWSGIDEFVSYLNANEQRELVRFLQPLVEEEQPGGSLKKLWKDSGAQIIITRIKPKVFFSELLSHVSDKST